MLRSLFLYPVDFWSKAVREAESKSLTKSEVDGTGLALQLRDGEVVIVCVLIEHFLVLNLVQ